MVLAINWCKHLDHAGVHSAERCNVKLLIATIPSQFKVASASVTQPFLSWQAHGLLWCQWLQTKLKASFEMCPYLYEWYSYLKVDKEYIWSGVVCVPLIPALRQREVDLCEFKPSLLYRENSRSARRLSGKKKAKQRDPFLLISIHQTLIMKI